jgi:hypothetical protein
MLESFRQTNIMTKKEQKRYDENVLLFHKTLSDKGVLYHIGVCYLYWFKQFSEIVCDQIIKLFECLCIIINCLFRLIIIFVIPFGAVARKRFHRKVWEKLKRKIEEDNRYNELLLNRCLECKNKSLFGDSK